MAAIRAEGDLSSPIKPCPHLTPTGANVVCDLLPGMLIGWQVCAGCDQQTPPIEPIELSPPIPEKGFTQEANRMEDPCFHRGTIATNRDEVCCGMLYTYDCTLGEFGGRVTVSDCAGCPKYE
jgi:hypothetical protein